MHTLKLSNNALVKCPDFLPPNLRILDLCNNKIRIINISAKLCCYVNLCNNKIIHVPDDLGLPNLMRLLLTGNNIKRLCSVPNVSIKYNIASINLLPKKITSCFIKYNNHLCMYNLPYAIRNCVINTHRAVIHIHKTPYKTKIKTRCVGKIQCTKTYIKIMNLSHYNMP